MRNDKGLKVKEHFENGFYIDKKLYINVKNSVEIK